MRTILAIMFVLLAVPAPGAAQEAPRHQGFWIGFGLGAGSDLSDQARDARAGGAGYLRLGGTISPSLLVGGEVGLWARRQDGVTRSRTLAAGIVTVYPVREGFFFKGGLGFATLTFEIRGASGLVTSITEEGFGGIVGGGYDIQMRNNLFLTPSLDFMIQSINNDTAVVGLLTIGLTWH